MKIGLVAEAAGFGLRSFRCGSRASFAIGPRDAAVVGREGCDPERGLCLFFKLALLLKSATRAFK
jgi:hypothetical protein